MFNRCYHNKIESAIKSIRDVFALSNGFNVSINLVTCSVIICRHTIISIFDGGSNLFDILSRISNSLTAIIQYNAIYKSD